MLLPAVSSLAFMLASCTCLQIFARPAHHSAANASLSRFVHAGACINVTFPELMHGIKYGQRFLACNVGSACDAGNACTRYVRQHSPTRQPVMFYRVLVLEPEYMYTVVPGALCWLSSKQYHPRLS